MGENFTRAKELVSILRKSFPIVRMPAESLPFGVARDSAAYRLFLTLTLSSTTRGMQMSFGILQEGPSKLLTLDIYSIPKLSFPKEKLI